MSTKSTARAIGALLAGLLVLPLLAQESQPFGETITVARYLVQIRAVDDTGKAITDLRETDFRVSIGKTSMTVESVIWVPSGDNIYIPDFGGTAEGDVHPQASSGRLIVLYIQTDFARNSQRVIGQMMFNPVMDRILEQFQPNDRVAVLEHDTHLKIRLDFTSDHDAIRRAVRDSIRVERVPLPEPSAGVSLVRHLDENTMRRSPSGESSLLVIAQAFHEVPGENKLIIVAGWGLGKQEFGRLVLSTDWIRAMEILHRDKVPMFTISTGLLGGTLTQGLVMSSQATGGAYMGTTQTYPEQVAVRMAGALAGHYELILKADGPLEPGQYALQVMTGRRGVKIVAPPSIIVKPDDHVNAEVELVQVDSSPTPAPPEPPNASALYIRAKQHLLRDELPEAEAILAQILTLDAQFAPALYERGMLALGREDLDGARRDLRRYLELEPNGEPSREVREILRRLDERR